MSLNSLKSIEDEAWLSQTLTFGSKSVPFLLPLLSTFAGLTTQFIFPDFSFLTKVDDESRHHRFSSL